MDALTDGLLVIRHLFGFSGDSLVSGALGPSAMRTDPVEIAAYIDDAISTDVDCNGDEDALTDGLLIIRSAFGFSGASLTNGAVGPGSTCTPEESEKQHQEEISC